METEYLGKKKGKVGIKVLDERQSPHKVEVGIDGEILFHGTNDYPHKREERTEEEQRIMTQVEERAKHAAQQEFPDADIVHPMWDPSHIEAGIKAFANYPLAKFHEEFRDFYEAMVDPWAFIDDPDLDPKTLLVNRSVHFRDGEILDFSHLVFEYARTDGTEHRQGAVPSIPDEEELVIYQPHVDHADDFDYEDQFQDIIMSHLFAQIRDIYLNMGEEPPEKYLVEGMGKIDIVGDGIGNL